MLTIYHREIYQKILLATNLRIRKTLKLEAQS